MTAEKIKNPRAARLSPTDRNKPAKRLYAKLTPTQLTIMEI